LAWASVGECGGGRTAYSPALEKPRGLVQFLGVERGGSRLSERAVGQSAEIEGGEHGSAAPRPELRHHEDPEASPGNLLRSTADVLRQIWRARQWEKIVAK